MKRIFLSDYVTADCDIYEGGGTLGTEKIQAVLDMADAGGLTVIVDGAFLTRTLYVSSHTTIYCPNERCGFYLADDTNAPLLKNRHWTEKGKGDSDIRLVGGTWNFNCTRQAHDVTPPEGLSFTAEFAHTFVLGMCLFGVDGLTVRDVVLRNQRTFAVAAGNVRDVLFENVRIDLPDLMYAQNQDGLHFFGPSERIVLRNISGTAGDDFIALAPDELDGTSSITDVLIDGVHLDNSDQGIRLLSRGSGILDRVIIRNVTGTFKSYGFFINPWISPHYGEKSYGHLGSVTIENVDLRQVEKKYDYTKPFLFRLGGVIDTLRLRNVHYVNCSEPADFMQIGSHYIFFDDSEGDCVTRIGKLLLENIEAESATEKAEIGGVIVKKAEIGLLYAKNLLGVEVENREGKIGRTL